MIHNDSVTDAKNNTMSYTYDADTDDLTSVSKTADGRTVSNSYTYENDRIKNVTHNGFGYNFGYDSLENNTTVSVGSAITYAYDELNEVVREDNQALGKTIAYAL